MRCFFVRFNTNSGTRRRIDIFQKRKMFRIEFPEILAWFQTPQTVSRPSRPNFQPHRTVEHTSQKLVSPQPPFTLKPRPKGAKKISGLVPDTHTHTHTHTHTQTHTHTHTNTHTHTHTQTHTHKHTHTHTHPTSYRHQVLECGSVKV